MFTYLLKYLQLFGIPVGSLLRGGSNGRAEAVQLGEGLSYRTEGGATYLDAEAGEGSGGITPPETAVENSVALFGSLPDMLAAQANLLVESGTVKIRQSGGVAGVDELHLYHNGTNGCVESKDGAVILLPLSGGGGRFEFYNTGILRSTSNQFSVQDNNGTPFLAVSPTNGITLKHNAQGTILGQLSPIEGGGFEINDGTVGQTRDLVLRDLIAIGCLSQTTDPFVAGQLWNDGGTVKISAG